MMYSNRKKCISRSSTPTAFEGRIYSLPKQKQMGTGYLFVYGTTN